MKSKVPLAVKILYSVFVAVLVPAYWILYGPTNFLYFCDVALLLTCAALWLESPLLASMPAVGILVPQALWVADFLAEASGFRLTGMTGYMFDAKAPLFTRGLSFFHFWLPFLLVWLVRRLGYDRRALAAWTGLATALMLVGFFILPAPPAPQGRPNLPVNVNYVHGLDDKAPQQWLPPLAYLALMLTAMPALIYVPTHFGLRRLCPARN